jgi:hypothetical protein
VHYVALQLNRFKYVHFSFSLASCWSYMSAALGYMASHDASDVAMGVVLLLCQIVGATVTIVVSVMLYSPSSNKFQLSAYIEPTALIMHARVHTCTSLIALTNPSLLIFLPWKSSDFTVRSNGYPNLDFFRVIVYLQSFISSVRCVALLVAQQSTSSTFTSLIFSVGMLLLTLSEAAIKLKAENIQQYDTAVVSRATLDAMKNIDMEAGLEQGDVEIQDTVNEDVKMQQEIEKLKLEIETLRTTNRQSFSTLEAPELEDSIHMAKLEYADENVDILKDQLNEVGMNPLEYIPLPKIEAELAHLTRQVNNGESFDEKRLDHLLACMERNPQYRATVEERRHREREKLAPILLEHLATMRGFVPPAIFSATLESLQQEGGYSKALAKRLMTKRCLWLVRMTPSDIMRLHEVDLTGKYGYGGQTLDVVEKTALLAAMPRVFENDGRGIKKKYLQELEDSVKQMIQQAEEHRLARNLLRNAAYKDQVGVFQEDTAMYSPDVTSSEDAFSPRMSFRSSAPSSLSMTSGKEYLSSTDADEDGVINRNKISDNEASDTLNPLHDSDRFSRSSSSSNFRSSAIGQSEMSKRTYIIDNLLSRSSQSSSSSSSVVDSSAAIGESEMQKRSAALSNLFK